MAVLWIVQSGMQDLMIWSSGLLFDPTWPSLHVYLVFEKKSDQISDLLIDPRWPIQEIDLDLSRGSVCASFMKFGHKLGFCEC